MADAIDDLFNCFDETAPSEEVQNEPVVENIRSVFVNICNYKSFVSYFYYSKEEIKGEKRDRMDDDDNKEGTSQKKSKAEIEVTLDDIK